MKLCGGEKKFGGAAGLTIKHQHEICAEEQHSERARSASVPGRSLMANQAIIEMANARRRSFVAVAGDGHTPQSIL
jgi:hypothetical protein